MHLDIWIATVEVVKVEEKGSAVVRTRCWVSRYCILLFPSPSPCDRTSAHSYPPSPALSTARPTAPSTASAVPLELLSLPRGLFAFPQISPPQHSPDETRGIAVAGQKTAVCRIAARRYPRRTSRRLGKSCYAYASQPLTLVPAATPWRCKCTLSDHADMHSPTPRHGAAAV